MSKIIAIGDIHGCFYTLSALLEQINPAKDDLLIFLGDFIDRGPFVKETIDILLSLEEQNFRTCFLMGNHEKMLLDTLHHPRLLQTWIFNGANTSLRSFGISKIQKLPDKYLDFFQRLQLYRQEENLLFVHAGFPDHNSSAFSDSNTMLWTRNETYSSPYFSDKIVVHGHTPVPPHVLNERIQNHEKVLNIDTGCVYPHREHLGYLSAIVFPEKKVFQCKNSDFARSQQI